MRFEGDLGDAALLRYAQEQAITWGAERFATEFKRRELEERWIEAAESHTTPYSPTDPVSPDMLSGPVDAAVQDAVVGSGRGAEIRLSRPAHGRHPSVPRPPEPEPEPVRRRLGRRGARSVPAPAPMLSPAEIAGMSAAGRRLYGLDDPE